MTQNVIIFRRIYLFQKNIDYSAQESKLEEESFIETPKVQFLNKLL